MWLSKRAIYAVHIGVVASFYPDGVSASQFAKRLGMPRSHILKILRVLQQSGIFATTRGRKGNFHLTRTLEQITMYEIANPFENFARYERYAQRTGRCASIDCPMHEFWTEVTNTLITKLRTTTLAEIKTYYDRKGDASKINLPEAWLAKGSEGKVGKPE